MCFIYAPIQYENHISYWIIEKIEVFLQGESLIFTFLNCRFPRSKQPLFSLIIFIDSVSLKRYVVENFNFELYLANHFVEWKDFRNTVRIFLENEISSTFSNFSVMTISFHKYTRNSMSQMVNGKFYIISGINNN